MRYPELSLKLKEARELAGFPTQEKLARAADITLSALQKWERGSSAPTFSQMGKLMPLLGRYGALILYSMGLSTEQICEMGAFFASPKHRNSPVPIVKAR